MALSRKEMDDVLAVLEAMAPTGHAAAYCMDHLAARAGVPLPNLGDLRTFVRALRGNPTYTVAERGVCDSGPHAVADLVIRRPRGSDLPTRR